MSRFGIPKGARHINTYNGILPFLTEVVILPPLAPSIQHTSLQLTGQGWKYDFRWSKSLHAVNYTYTIFNITTNVQVATATINNFRINTVSSLIHTNDNIRFSVYASNALGNSPTSTTTLQAI